MSQYYNVYTITGPHVNYIGITTKSLEERMRQHHRDAISGKCSLGTTICSKEQPQDVKDFYSHLRRHPSLYKIKLLRQVYGSYSTAHEIENQFKKNHY